MHASREVLRRKLAKADINQIVGIKYQGPPNNGARSHRYRVLVYEPDGTYTELEYDDAAKDPGFAGDEATELARRARRASGTRAARRA